jgi:hypothetical protein
MASWPGRASSGRRTGAPRRVPALNGRPVPRAIRMYSVIHLARDKWLSNAPAGAIQFLFRIKMQHHSFALISTFRISVE